MFLILICLDNSLNLFSLYCSLINWIDCEEDKENWEDVEDAKEDATVLLVPCWLLLEDVEVLNPLVALPP